MHVAGVEPVLAAQQVDGELRGGAAQQLSLPLHADTCTSVIRSWSCHDVMHVKDVTNAMMLLTVTLDGGLQPLPELEADGGHHEAGVGHELSVPHLTQGHGDNFMGVY